jgi:short-subunit dehydrogenase
MGLSNSDKKRLKEKYGPWALVTGASNGIGQELAEQIASAGLNVIVHGRNLKKLEGIAMRLQSHYLVDTRIISSDVATSEGVEAIFHEVDHLDVGLVVVSAGYGTSGLFHDGHIEDEVNMLRVNCESLLRVTHHFSKIFVGRRKGGIVLMSSLVAFQGVPYAAHYAATKAYVQSFAEAIAEELRPFGVDILAAAPGPVASGFGERADMKMSMSLTPEQVGVPILEALGKRSTVLPGLLTKFLVRSLGMLPRKSKVKAMKRVMGGMTAHQRA